MPTPSRNGSGYRVYGDDDLVRLLFIRRGQELALAQANVGIAMGTGTDVAIRSRSDAGEKGISAVSAAPWA